ncbi:carbamoyltransferase HypF [Vacuolonema iberomarrocanum]|uniref:carbamoyltransferase HypF n=1 Tax=Vacuolonema iberomarrocanum TaxID=3454632 RepID=UPI0019F5B64B|nr:carbamoyltransferase HypF [filamentous cyanobacterium LEGE 07170]
METAAEIRVKGTVQGVGFRPMVYQLALTHHLRGSVYNDAAGVVIRVAGTAQQVEQFVEKLQPSAPPLAKIESIQRQDVAIATIPQTEFEITPSRPGQVRTNIAPDAATCPQCLSDTLDPFGRFYRYPFTNCTHCGPRLSIVRAIPYDRGNTSMATFPMCPDCQKEYDNPLNRRFHAQPVACYHCGPKAWLERADGKPVVADMFSMLDDVDAVCTLIQRGEIVAIKGIGGIHLACDATNDAAVNQLRQRKHRYHKPFALMVRDLSVIAPYCDISDGERALLESPAAPIVLLSRKEWMGRWGDEAMSEGALEHTQTHPLPIRPATHPPLSPAISPNLSTLGVMLPYTPLHHLMLKRMNRPIVLTSGNRSDEPQCIDNETAREKLGAIATYFLLHDREIVNRVDDSVVRMVAGQPQTLRRARGYAPEPIQLPVGFEEMPPILAMGGELKSTFCLGNGGEAILSQHLGDLEEATAFAAYEETLALYQQLFEHQPVAIAADLHPDYRSTQLAHTLAQEQSVPLHSIQHHHAHIAACMVEHGLPIDTTPVLGIALDGLGYGADDTLWGGEFLVADYRDFQRVAHLEPMAMLGGAQATRQPWRNTYAQLMAAMDWDDLTDQFGDLDIVKFLATQPRSLLNQMLTTQLRSPLASSAGRLFDAVAAAVGCCRDTASYEGQGAIELEALIQPEAVRAAPYPFALHYNQNPMILSAQSLWPELLKDLQQGVETSVIAARFHQGFAQAISDLAVTLANRHHLSQVVLSGGVFQNQVLLIAVQEQLRQQGLTVLTPQAVPPNDGGLSLGQVAIAAARLHDSP